MAGEPEVSVLMSVHNGGRFLPSATGSILRQTLRDLELIVVDDGSTDGTWQYLERLRSDDARVRAIRLEARSGQGGALNIALGLARAPWVAILDADDVSLESRIEKQLSFVRQHPGLKGSGCLAYYIDDRGRRLGKSAHDLVTEDDYRRYIRENQTIGFWHSGAFLERATVERLGGYRARFDPAHDCDLLNRIADAGVVLIQPEHLIEYRVHPKSATATRSAEMRLKYEWVRACTLARRGGRCEPPLSEFLAVWGAAPYYSRVSRWRKAKAKRLYRQAGLEYAYGMPIRAGAHLLASAVLQPSYAIPLFLQQRL